MSWSSVKTEGIVLAVLPAREADREYHILTPTHGKVRVLGRGAQKIQAKLASHLEPFGIVQIEFIRGRRSTTIISVDNRHRFRAFDVHIDRRLMVQSGLALIDRYTHEDDMDTGLYSHVVDWLSFLDVNEAMTRERRVLLLGAFLLRFMKYQGYALELARCLVCRETIFPLAYKWHAGKGGLVCTDCLKKDEREWFAAAPMAEEVLTMLRLAVRGSYTDIASLALPADHVDQFARAVYELILLHIPGREQPPFWELVG